jgi:uncharacterized Zn finger protein (UPF0148 family)
MSNDTVAETIEPRWRQDLLAMFEQYSACFEPGWKDSVGCRLSAIGAYEYLASNALRAFYERPNPDSAADLRDNVLKLAALAERVLQTLDAVFAPSAVPQADGHSEDDRQRIVNVLSIRRPRTIDEPIKEADHPPVILEAARPPIATACPSCGQPSLRVSDDGHLYCSRMECPEQRVGKALANLVERARIAEDLAVQDRKDAAQLQVLHTLLAADVLTDAEKAIAALSIVTSALGSRLRGRA